MMRTVKVLGGVLVLGGVAAADMPAGEADPQVDPSVAGFHTIFTNVTGGLEIASPLEVFA
jgi:hypothetical protein